MCACAAGPVLVCALVYVLVCVVVAIKAESSERTFVQKKTFSKYENASKMRIRSYFARS